MVQTVFGDLLRVNYVVDPRVKGRVTFRSVAPVPRENVLPLMEVILRLNGIAVVEEGGLHRIIPISDIAREPVPVRYGREPEKITVTGKSLLQVVPIANVQSTEIVKLLTPFLSSNAVLIDVPRGNQLIMVDTDANVKRLLELVRIFDGEQFRRRKGQVHVYPVQNSKAKDVATLLQQIFLGATAPARTGREPGSSPQAVSLPVFSPGASGLVSDITRIFSDEIINSVIVVSTPEDYEIIKEAIQKIDLVPRQVVIEGVVAEITLSDDLNLGVAWSLHSSFNARGSTYSGITAFNPKGLQVNPELLSLTGFTFAGVDDTGRVRALVSALASDSKAKLLAAPHILVADNRQARIQVGKQVPITTAETFGTPGVAPQRVIQYKDIGIILKVRPQINESGLVALEINQEVSTYSTQKLFVDSTEIILHKSEASTNLVVQDGQTIIIGGLIREDTSRATSGIPWLHKIPLIGPLFGGITTGSSRQEILILLTPHVIKTIQEAKDVTRTYVDTFTDQGRVKKEELMKGLSGREKTKEPPASETGQGKGK